MLSYAQYDTWGRITSNKGSNINLAGGYTLAQISNVSIQATKNIKVDGISYGVVNSFYGYGSVAVNIIGKAILVNGKYVLEGSSSSSSSSSSTSSSSGSDVDAVSGSYGRPTTSVPDTYYPDPSCDENTGYDSISTSGNTVTVNGTKYVCDTTAMDFILYSKKPKGYDHFIACLYNDNVYVGPGISEATATTVMLANNTQVGVFMLLKKDALEFIKKIGPYKENSPHGGAGHYGHYHLLSGTKQQHAHLWYGWGLGN